MSHLTIVSPDLICSKKLQTLHLTCANIKHRFSNFCPLQFITHHAQIMHRFCIIHTTSKKIWSLWITFKDRRFYRPTFEYLSFSTLYFLLDYVTWDPSHSLPCHNMTKNLVLMIVNGLTKCSRIVQVVHHRMMMLISQRIEERHHSQMEQR